MALCRASMLTALASPHFMPVANAIDWLPINGAASDVAGSMHRPSWLGYEHTASLGPVAAGLDDSVCVQSGFGHSDSNTSASIFAGVENKLPIATNVSLSVGVDKGRLSDPSMQISLHGTATWSANIVNHSEQGRNVYCNVSGIGEPTFHLLTASASCIDAAKVRPQRIEKRPKERLPSTSR